VQLGEFTNSLCYALLAAILVYIVYLSGWLTDNQAISFLNDMEAVAA